MRHLVVPRTCSELDPEGIRRSGSDPAKPLEEFRSRAAYVLLGDPGMGKTTAFLGECDALGTEALFITARNFLAFDPDSRTEWRSRILFIDGLDEVRAGNIDGRTPVDGIRSRLDHLRPPGFRIACREAEWLGENDLRHIKQVSPDRKLTVLRLDPLDKESCKSILQLRLGEQAESFIREAQAREMEAILDNPLTLGLLVEATEDGATWPENRFETFEMACKVLARESNEEHRIGYAARSVPVAKLLDVAGYACAVLLLSGYSGYLLGPSDDSSARSALLLSDLDGAPLVDRECLSAALGTRLFRAEGSCFVPVHRSIAEFLAGRYLATLVEDRDLPVGRVLALLTTPERQVPSRLRGLSAWLSAHSPSARSELIRVDPVGVGLYGDLSRFTASDKQLLLRTLSRYAAQGSRSGHASRDGLVDAVRNRSIRMFRRLAEPDMVPAIEGFMEKHASGEVGHRLVEFFLKVLACADLKHASELARLAPQVSKWMRGRRPMPVRRAALDAYLHLVPSGTARDRELKALLDELQDSVNPDPSDELRGTLLRALYPGVVTPSTIWRYAIPYTKNFFGRFQLFWTQIFVEESAPAQIGEALDALAEMSGEGLEELAAVIEDHFVPELLTRGLRNLGDAPDVERLYKWLNATMPFTDQYGTYSRRDQPIRQWLEDRGHIINELFLQAARLAPNSDRPISWIDFRDLIRGSRLPDGFGRFCFDRSLCLASTEPDTASVLLEQAHHSLDDPAVSVGLTRSAARERLIDYPGLQRLFDDFDRRRLQALAHQARTGSRIERIQRERKEKVRKRETEWDEYLRVHEVELKENRLTLYSLNLLAKVYLGLITGVESRAIPSDRVARFIGGDPALAELVMTALRDAIWRADLPSVSRTISWHSDQQFPSIAWPVAVSLELLGRDASNLRRINVERRRRALALAFFSPMVPGHPYPSDRCLEEWLVDDPDSVFDVLTRCARAAVRNGDRVIAGVIHLDRIKGHTQHVCEARSKLLEAFSTRIAANQLPAFDYILATALQSGSLAAIERLADRKLGLRSLDVGQGVRWRMVKAMLAGGGKAASDLHRYATANERRVRHLAEFLDVLEDAFGSGSQLAEGWDSKMLIALVSLLGPYYEPITGDGPDTQRVQPSFLLSDWIFALGSRPDGIATRGLDRLLEEPRMAKWRKSLERSRDLHRVVVADSAYRRPDPDLVRRTLSNLQPANAADLHTLLVDIFTDISARIRGDSANLWRGFHNEDPYGRPQGAKPENSCRDILLQELKHRLPVGVNASAEGRYVSDKRADIRVSYRGFNIPVEIKKDSSSDLWTGISRQLVDQYTTDPETGGYGIYLVLRFDESGDSHRRIENLKESVPIELRHKISVLAIDVTKPEPSRSASHLGRTLTRPTLPMAAVRERA